ncbi:M24 family metallopeptidase [Nonomuraea ferruginea]
MRSGELVTIDFGAAYQGYHADMTRTVCLGPPADWQSEVYDLVAEAQRVTATPSPPRRHRQGGRRRRPLLIAAAAPRRPFPARPRPRRRARDP